MTDTGEIHSNYSSGSQSKWLRPVRSGNERDGDNQDSDRETKLQIYEPKLGTSKPYVERFNIGNTACDKRREDEEDGLTSLIFTHGLETGIEDPKTSEFAEGFSTISPVVCFQGNRSLQARIRAFHKVTQHENPSSALGGRSMGARAAVLTALERGKDENTALVLVSYPLFAGHAGETREFERRERILLDLPASVDVLFIIGSEDPQGHLKDLAQVRTRMKARSWLVEVQGADHGMDLKSDRGSRLTRIMSGVIAARWLRARDSTKRYCCLWWNEDAVEVQVDSWKAEEGEPLA